MLHKNASDKFSFENCKFTIQRSKESTGRWRKWQSIRIHVHNSKEETIDENWHFQGGLLEHGHHELLHSWGFTFLKTISKLWYCWLKLWFGRGYMASQIMICWLNLWLGPSIFFSRHLMADRTWAQEPSPISTVEIMRFDIISHISVIYWWNVVNNLLKHWKY